MGRLGLNWPLWGARCILRDPNGPRAWSAHSGKVSTESATGSLTSMPDIGLQALAFNVEIPEGLRWTDERRGEVFELQSITVRLLPDGSLAAKAYGRPIAGGRGAYVSFPVRRSDAIDALITDAASEASQRWAHHTGL